MLVWKEIIPGPGTYWYRDQEAGTPRTITFTPDGIKHLHDSGKALLGGKLSVPVPLEHQPWALPMAATDLAAYRARHNVGETRDYRLSAKGGLDALLDIHDDDVARKLGKSLLWTSPYITSFTDGGGRDWTNVIAHNAITTRPRITDQQPFPSVAAALSLVPQLPHATFDARAPLATGLAVAFAGRLVPQEGGAPGLAAAYPVAFSLLTGARLTDVELAEAAKTEGPSNLRMMHQGKVLYQGRNVDEFHKAKEAYKQSQQKKPPAKLAGKGEADEVAGEPEPKEGAVPAPGPEEMPELDPETGMPVQHKVDPDGDIPVWEVIRDLLEHEGLTLPEGTSHENFYENLYTCLMDKLKAGPEQPEVPMADPMNPPQTGIPQGAPPTRPPSVVQEQPPLYMSLADVEKVQDLALRQALRVGLSLQENAFNQAKERRLARVDKILKRAPYHKREALRNQILQRMQGARLSLGTDGAVRDEMAEWLDLMDQVIDVMPDTPALLQGAGAVAQPHPQEYQGEMSEERRRQVVAELTRNLRLPEPPGQQKAG